MDDLKVKLNSKDVTLQSISKLNVSKVDRLPKFFDINEEIKNVSESKLLQLQVAFS